jgi:hypothetical protein
MSKKINHVVPSSKGGWEVRTNGSQKATIYKETKKEAIDTARQLSKNQGALFVIHGKEGQILHTSLYPTKLRENDVRQAIRGVAFKDPAPPKDNTKRTTKSSTSRKK